MASCIYTMMYLLPVGTIESVNHCCENISLANHACDRHKSH